VAENKSIPIICGPTASGKTAVAVEIAGRFPIEVISADYRQIIRYLNIGTAKPTADEQRQVRFHLVDIIDPGERYNAYRFIEDADRAVSNILQRGKMPMVVGGTGLYLRALTEGVVEMDENDMEIRENLERDMKQLGPQVMYERLKVVDPLEASRIHPHNHVRIIRALEIYNQTGRSKSELMATSSHRTSRYRYEYYCLLPDRKQLYDRINNRVDSMISQGLLDEVQKLVDNGYSEAVRKANVIGYNELLDHIKKHSSLEEAVTLIKQNSRRYAKRQVTWFKNQLSGAFYSNPTEILNVLLGNS
jgi:tRNA dimethylallyltransferase